MVTTMVQTGNVTPNVIDVILLILKVNRNICGITCRSNTNIPKILHAERLWKPRER